MSRKMASGKARITATRHEALIARVGIAIRRMGAQSVITGRTVAARFGLHPSDLEVLDLIFLREQASAGELAEATGLTSGSVTALIDRLAAAGYVERHADPGDRRKVLVRIRHRAVSPIKATYATMQKRMFALWSTYGSRDLELIADFASRSTALAVDCCKDIAAQAPPAVRQPRRKEEAPARPRRPRRSSPGRKD